MFKKLYFSEYLNHIRIINKFIITTQGDSFFTISLILCKNDNCGNAILCLYAYFRGQTLDGASGNLDKHPTSGRKSDF